MEIPTQASQNNTNKEYIDFRSVLPEFKRLASSKCRNKEYTINAENSPVIEMLLLYFCNDPEFEKLPLGKNLKTTPSLKKGIYIGGNSGSGKSLLLEIFSSLRIPGNEFSIVHSDVLKNEYKITGEFALNKYYRRFKDEAMKKPNVLCFDELGYERKFKDYGQQMPFMLDVIMNRNRGWVDLEVKTHFTSNCHINEIEDMYDYRTAARITEMCNIIYLGTNINYTDYRKK